jgi:F-type H+-transporting ATPase subunit b
VERLGINWPLLIAQIFNVALVVWLVRSFLMTPILNMLNERTKRIQDSLAEADRMKAQVADSRKAYESELAKARTEAAGVLAQAQERAKSQEAEIIAQARNEAERIKAEAREAAAQERERQIGELKGQMAQLVTATASKVLSAELKQNHDTLIAESLASFGRKN